MAIYQPSKEVLLAAVNAQNSLNIKLTDITYSAPKDIRGTDQATTTQRNTLVKITATPTGSWTGKKNLFYTRLNIEDIQQLIGDTLQVGGVEKLHDALIGLNNRYGFAFEPEDLVNTDLEWEPDGQTGFLDVTAEADSLGWIGTARFKLVKGDESLQTAVTTTTLNGLKYPNGDMGSVNQTAILAEVYSYPFDFTTQRDALLVFGTGVLAAGATLNNLVGILNPITGTTWVASNAASWGLLGAEITYNGLNKAEFPTNSKYKYAMAIKLPATTTNIKGTLYVQYNDPDDPNEV
ncbi:virion structural protein [Cronobacter phage CR5]|uniref:virion structural protein n=1 Tax=Cronobacter phage CR5 TaxID=1195085 RepID=UPI0003426D32|nr:virion structural protein [Cronobacter phage CR5]AFO71361.1 hypothetical protein CR5_141 [Cronobacter phage CR5]